MLAALDIPSLMLPYVTDSSRIYGFTHRGIFDVEIPIAGIAGDQQAALFGQTCFNRRHGQKHLWHRLFYADEHRE